MRMEMEMGMAVNLGAAQIRSDGLPAGQGDSEGATAAGGSSSIRRTPYAVRRTPHATRDTGNATGKGDSRARRGNPLRTSSLIWSGRPALVRPRVVSALAWPRPRPWPGALALALALAWACAMRCGAGSEAGINACGYSPPKARC
jgi:hypothetical protein